MFASVASWLDGASIIRESPALKVIADVKLIVPTLADAAKVIVPIVVTVPPEVSFFKLKAVLPVAAV